MADYWKQHKVLFDLFQEGAFGEETNTIYQEYISVSPIFGTVKQIREQQMQKGGKLTICSFKWERILRSGNKVLWDL